MNIVFVESLGMCECTINKSLATLKNQGHTVTFYHDRNENEEVLIERARNAEVVVVSNIPLRKHFFENCPSGHQKSVETRSGPGAVPYQAPVRGRPGKGGQKRRGPGPRRPSGGAGTLPGACKGIKLYSPWPDVLSHSRARGKYRVSGVPGQG